MSLPVPNASTANSFRSKDVSSTTHMPKLLPGDLKIGISVPHEVIKIYNLNTFLKTLVHVPLFAIKTS